MRTEGTRWCPASPNVLGEVRRNGGSASRSADEKWLLAFHLLLGAVLLGPALPLTVLAASRWPALYVVLMVYSTLVAVAVSVLAVWSYVCLTQDLAYAIPWMLCMRWAVFRRRRRSRLMHFMPVDCTHDLLSEALITSPEAGVAVLRAMAVNRFHLTRAGSGNVLVHGNFQVWEALLANPSQRVSDEELAHVVSLAARGCTYFFVDFQDYVPRTLQTRLRLLVHREGGVPAFYARYCSRPGPASAAARAASARWFQLLQGLDRWSAERTAWVHAAVVPA